MRPKILFVASEAVPLAKTGGLGDVIGALSASLVEEGVDVTVLMPGYPSALEGTGRIRRVTMLSDMPGGPCSLEQGMISDTGVKVLLLRNDTLYDRPGSLYLNENGQEFHDNPLRFGALCHAAAAIGTGKTRLPVPQIVQAHDWHTGLVPYLLHRERSSAKSIFTIHNLAFQGNYPYPQTEHLKLQVSASDAAGIEYWGQMSFMKAGLSFADRITTVSETYAREILTPEFGSGFDGLLRTLGSDLLGIPNGIDNSIWDPRHDSMIVRTYGPDDMRGKSVCKRDLQRMFGLPIDPFIPVLAMGSRLTTQKMADVVIQALPELLKDERLQVVLLGCGDSLIETQLTELAVRHPDRIGVHIGYDEHRAHCLHAGADMLLHGSRFEPFGLAPLYALRYGTIPIASRVGGMVDTLVDTGMQEEPAADATGVLFDGDRVVDMIAAVDRALALFRRPSEWRKLQHNAMLSDFGWQQSSRRYIDLYSALLEEEATTLFPRFPENTSSFEPALLASLKRG